MMLSRFNVVFCLTILGFCAFRPTVAIAEWQKIPTPPDIDKDTAEEGIDCWLITSANMLAAAGYGRPGGNEQRNAEMIYEQLKQKFPPTGG